MISHESQFSFDWEEWGLLGNALNEVLNGFKVSDFERTIGAKRGEAESLLDKLHALPRDADEITLNVAETRAARNALSETLRKLSVQDFSIRTGVDFDRGTAILENIDRVL